MINKGQKVRLLKEYCDAPEEQDIIFLVVAGEEEGKPRITIEQKTEMFINPTQVIKSEMVEVVA